MEPVGSSVRPTQTEKAQTRFEKTVKLCELLSRQSSPSGEPSCPARPLHCAAAQTLTPLAPACLAPAPALQRCCFPPLFVFRALIGVSSAASAPPAHWPPLSLLSDETHSCGWSLGSRGAAGGERGTRLPRQTWGRCQPLARTVQIGRAGFFPASGAGEGSCLLSLCPAATLQPEDLLGSCWR